MKRVLLVLFFMISGLYAQQEGVDSTNYFLLDPTLKTDEQFDFKHFSFKESVQQFIAPKLSGGIFKLRDYCGEVDKNFKFKRYIKTYKKDPRKYVIISFFASYCQPCKHELPQLFQLYNNLSRVRDDIKLILVGMDPNKGDVSNFINKNLNGLVPKDAELLYNPSRNKLSPGTIYKVEKLPTLFILDKDGKVILEHVGFQEDYRLMDKIKTIFDKYEVSKN